MQYVLASLVVGLSLQYAPPTVVSAGLGRAPIAAGAGRRVSDAEIRKRMIEESIEAYPGPCACPYQRARNGSQCGRRSAYSRSGGYETLCYASDVSDEMVRQYRDEMGLR